MGGEGGGEMLQLLLQIYFDVIKRSVLGFLTIFRTVNFSSVLLVVASRACDVLLTAPRRVVSTLCPWLRHQVSQALIYWVAVERLQFCSFCFYYSFDIWFLIPLLVTENCNSFVSRCRSRTLQYTGNWALDIRWRSAKPKTSKVCVCGKGGSVPWGGPRTGVRCGEATADIRFRGIPPKLTAL